jgi:pimeloyl-ACP methyl ester carboxylesterase
MAEKKGLPTRETKVLQKELKILQKEIDINGIKLSYKDNGVKGDPIVFLHRSSLSSDTFKNQFAAKEFQKYRLLAPDMPGHGNSKPPREPDIFYSIEALTQIIVNWIEHLDLKNALMVGHSTGGHILMSAWLQISSRARGLIIFGAPPFSADKNPDDSHYGHPSYALTQQGKLNKDEIENLAKLFVKKDGQVDPVIIDSIKKSDPAMRPIISQSISELSSFDTESENIKQLTQPIAILQGRYDKILKRTYFDRLEIPKLWRKKVQLIDNSGHCPQLENPEQFNQMIQQFIIDQVI